MKRLLYFVLAFSCCAVIEAQTIQNGGFETWYYGKPIGWTTDLHGTLTSFVDFPVSIEFGEKTAEAHSGESALKLQSASYTVPVMGYTAKIPGILQIGEADGFSIPAEDLMNIVQAFQDTTGGNFDFDNLQSLSSVAKILANGVPCSKTPAAVSLWAKYLPDGNDWMSIVALTKKDGEIVDFTYNTFDTREQYAQVGVNFNFPDTPCDTIQIIVMSSLTINKNSVLYIDDVEILDSPLGLQQQESNIVEVYPNPSSGKFRVNVDDNRGFIWKMTDMTGRVVSSGNNSGDGYVDVSGLPAGVYVLEVSQDDREESRKVVIR